MNTTSVTLDKDVKRRLDSLKAHKRESYNDVISRLVTVAVHTEMDDDSLAETIEILSDPEMLRSLAKSIDDMKKGRVYSLEEV